ncbi:MAG: cytidylate kinase family protein [Syntrophales bacterium]|nr:cytidylate kinase family protein [Syntrophales bacterium]
MAMITIFSGSYCRADEVAKMVAQRLGYGCIGEELLEETAKLYNVSQERLKRAMYGPPSVFSKFTHEKVRNVAYVKAILARHVKENNIVYHGFAGHLLPRDITHILKVCIVASHDYRAAQAMEKEGVSEKEAQRIIRKDDNECREWTKYLFGLGPWDTSLYDIKIPMHESSVEEAGKIICDNVTKKALETTPKSQQAADDFVLAAQVNVALAEGGHEVEVSCNNGNITIMINKYVLRLEHLEKELWRIAGTVAGVKSAHTRVGPKFEPPAIYPPKFDFELPSRILLVDDEKEFVQTLSERLQTRHIEAAVAYNGEEALSFVESEEPEVMVLDLKMPGIDGIEVLRRVKREHPNVEVIILTGHGTEREEILARELGAFAYLKKPVDIDVLSQTMKEAYRKLNLTKKHKT